MMRDPFITQSGRGDIDDEVLGSDDMSVVFYEGITAFPAFQNENFTVPQLQGHDDS